MKSDTSYFFIGLFVIAGVILLTVGVTVLGTRGAGPGAVLCYTLLEESVPGLETGAAVRFRGITVGRVERLRIASQVFETDASSILVDFNVSQKGADAEKLRERIEGRIKQGLRIRYATSGLSGVGYLNADIVEGAEDEPLPKAPAWIPDKERLFIPSSVSTLEDLVNSLRKFLDDLRDTDVSGLVEDAKKTLTTITATVEELKLTAIEANVNQLLVDADAAVKGIEGQAGTFLDAATAAANSVTEAVKRVEALVDDPRVGATLTNVDELTARVNEILADPNINETLVNVEKASAEAEAAIAAIRKAAEPIPGVVNDVRRLIQGKGRDVDRILRNIDQLTAHLNNLAATIERYPSYLLFGNPPPRKEPEK